MIEPPWQEVEGSPSSRSTHGHGADAVRLRSVFRCNQITRTDGRRCSPSHKAWDDVANHHEHCSNQPAAGEERLGQLVVAVGLEGKIRKRKTTSRRRHRPRALPDGVIRRRRGKKHRGGGRWRRSGAPPMPSVRTTRGPFQRSGGCWSMIVYS